MSSTSDPRDWYRQEEKARERIRNRISRAPSSKINFIYVAAGIVAAAVILFLYLAYGTPTPRFRALSR